MGGPGAALRATALPCSRRGSPEQTGGRRLVVPGSRLSRLLLVDDQGVPGVRPDNAVLGQLEPLLEVLDRCLRQRTECPVYCETREPVRETQVVLYRHDRGSAAAVGDLD